VKGTIHSRISRLQELMADRQIDTVMILTNENRTYLSGFTGEDSQFDESSGALFIHPGKFLFATDSRFTEQVKNEAPDYEIYCYKKGLAKEFDQIIKNFNIHRLGFESKRISQFQYDAICEQIQDKNIHIDLVPVDDMLGNFRVTKDEKEIAIIKKALHLSENVFIEIKKQIRLGMTEKELAWELEKLIRSQGGDALSFPSIIASGPNSALPHAIPGERKLQKGDPLLFDWGTVLEGYCSDISRTLFLGKPDKKFMDIFNTVLDAQMTAISAIKAGESGKKIDGIARKRIEDRGYGAYFGHGLGHGVGLAVHEPPRLSPLSNDTLEEGMVVTVEPGIYIPGWGGVRLENLIVVRKDHAEVLNATEAGDFLFEI
jgi:Xaa-Pro aminopeptidase